jgi:hypothetical protein
MRRWLRLGKGDGRNNIAEIKKYLSTPDQPLTMEEFREFWDSCSEEEKEQFKTTQLPSEKF